MTDETNQILRETFMGLYYRDPSELGEDAFAPMDDKHNVLRDSLAMDLLNHLLTIPELQDEDTDEVHRHFQMSTKGERQKGAAHAAYDYAGGVVNGRNQLRREIREALKRELGTEADV